jgi:Tol biopolymer transport system component
MNKEILDQLPADEKSVIEKLNFVSENMKVPQAFQWTLESQLMDAYQNKSQPGKGWFSKIIVPVAWTLAIVAGVALMNWMIRPLVPPEQSQPASSSTEVPFETQVRREDICKGPLAVAHGFSVALTNDDKTAFIPLDADRAIGELRSFAWSVDGDQLAVLGNTTGNGNIYITDSSGAPLQPVLARSELGYLYAFAWSRDGSQFVTWSGQNNMEIFLFNADGSGLTENQLDVHILGTQHFWPDGSSLVFFGSDEAYSGLYEAYFANMETALINSYVTYDGSYAFSPDGTQVAMMEYDRENGEARLVSLELTTREQTVLGSFPIPKGSGSSLPETANLSWSQDGTKLVFEFGRGVEDRAIHLAYADGSGMIKLADTAHAPAISADGKCLAFIRNKQVFVIDLENMPPSSTPAEPLFLADLPAPRSSPDFRLDKLQWQP